MLRRIFIAMNLPKEAKNKLLQYQKNVKELFTPYHPDEGRTGSGPARWTTPDNLHITLVFLDNTAEKELQEVQKIVRKVAANHKTFSFSLSQVVYGPTEKQTRMIWAKGIPSKELLSLQKDLVKALRNQEEHPYSLHITLARLKEWEYQKIDTEESPILKEEIELKVLHNKN